MKVFNADIAMGINNAVMKKKTLFLMSCSVAISIVMLLGFQVFVDFLHVSMKTTKPSTPDVSLISDQGLSIDLYKEVSDLDGVKRAYGRMLGYAEANFDASILTDAYKKSVGGIKETSDGLFVPPEKSWFISYDQNQLNWAKENLIEGDLSEEKLNKQNGLIAVVMPVRKGISMETAAFSLGDKVYVKTPGGTKEMMVMAILRTVPFDDPNPSVTAFITTEKLFTELTGESSLKIIDIQVHKQGQEQTINIIQSMIDKSVTLSDQRQKNNEVDQAFMTMAVFIYGFVVVIAIISILNIINTMNTSVASKKQYLGVMRAVGMSGDQLTKMVFMEATTYGLLGSLAGCMLGIGLQKVLITKILSQYHIAWHFPLMQIVLIVVVVLLVTVFAVTGPLKRINAQGVAEVIGSF